MKKLRDVIEQLHLPICCSLPEVCRAEKRGVFGFVVRRKVRKEKEGGKDEHETIFVVFSFQVVCD